MGFPTILSHEKEKDITIPQNYAIIKKKMYSRNLSVNEFHYMLSFPTFEVNGLNRVALKLGQSL